MKVKRRRSSGSFSDDDKPLITMKMRHDDHNSYVSLCRHNKQLCEFCDMVFENRYRRIIHNMKHIIIPLLNLKVYQCNECLHHFTSHRDLINHTRNKHPKEQLPETKLVIKHQNVIHTETNPIIIDLTLPNEDDYSQLPSMSDLVPRENSVESGSIKSRLIFEDDLVDNCDKLLNNFTINCQVQLEPCEVKTELKMSNGVVKYEQNGDDFGKTVHYDDLLKPGVFRCKKCGKRFPARYEAIIHEASHIIFKNARVTLCGTCNEYIVGNGKALMLHYLANHKQRPKDTQKKTEQNLIMLGNNPLKTITSNNKEEMTKKVLMFEEEVTSYSKTLMLCDLCLSFCKSGNSRNYVCVGSVNELGKRYPCSKCGSLFFEVNLVKQSINLRRHSDVKKVRKKTSNEVRLKSIQNRFKLLKN